MKFTIYFDVSNEWRWRLTASNNKIIATSGEGYKNYLDCLHMARQIKSGAYLAEIIEPERPKSKR